MMANAGGGSWTWVWPAARRRVGVVGLVACLAIGDVGRCCDNPVFRYALENWPSAEYLLVTAGAEAAADAARIDQLLAVAEPRPNLRLASAGELPQLDASGPLVLVAPPPPRGQPGRPQVTWSGPASEESLARVVDSPARRELAKRLLDGEAIVWVVLEVSDREAIDKGEAALQQLIDGYLEALAQAEAAAAATAPPPDPQAPPPIDKSAFWPPRFSVLRVAADAAEEAVFVATLLGTTQEASAQEPLVFPVFGRGRVLGSLPLSKLDAGRLRSACDFLTGACSCEVKEMNPGQDLLFAADWDSVAKLTRPTGTVSLFDLEPAGRPAAAGSPPAPGK